MSTPTVNRWRLRSLLGGTVLVVAATIWLYLAGSFNQAPAPGDSPGTTPVRDADDASDASVPVPADATTEVAAPDNGALWEAIAEGSVPELPDYKEFVPDRVLVRVRDVTAGWRVGQRIAVPVPQLDETYTPVIERIEGGSGDVRSYIGTLTAVAGRAHRFTITVGRRNTFAHLSTPSGTYELVATGELGWLMPTIGMDRHVDYNVPDFVIPEGPVILER